jgi:dihydropteroate synthase
MIFAHRTGAWDFVQDDRVRLVGILNVTPDSFYDGGRWNDPGLALEHAARMTEEGADALDVGGQSTRPGIGAPVGPEEEWRRIEPVLEGLSNRRSIPLSVDTYHADVARRALDAGAAMVNDISGLTADPGMLAVVAASGAGLVIMHSVGAPDALHTPREYADVGADIEGFLAARLAGAIAGGVRTEHIALDPGVGFSKRADQSMAALRALPRLTRLGRPLYIGVSRKSFLESRTGRPVEERLAASLGATVAAVALGARIVRTHDVAATRDALRAAQPLLHLEREASRS